MVVSTGNTYSDQLISVSESLKGNDVFCALKKMKAE